MGENETQGARLDARLPQKRALLEVAEAIASHRDLGALFHDLAERCTRWRALNFSPWS